MLGQRSLISINYKLMSLHYIPLTINTIPGKQSWKKTSINNIQEHKNCKLLFLKGLKLAPHMGSWMWINVCIWCLLQHGDGALYGDNSVAVYLLLAVYCPSYVLHVIKMLSAGRHYVYKRLVCLLAFCLVSNLMVNNSGLPHNACKSTSEMRLPL